MGNGGNQDKSTEKTYMKRLLFSLLIILLIPAQHALAQMTDEQVVEYAQSRYQAGESQKDIALGLLRQGVTQEQILRLRDKYTKKNNTDDKPTSTSTTSNRLRTSNGELVPDKELKSQKNKRLKSTKIGELEDNEEEEDTEEEEEVPRMMIFGHDIFRSKNLTFEPNMNIATPASYILGPGDEVIVDVYGASQYSEQFVIAPDGSIVIPNVGPVSISGMTQAKAQERIRQHMGEYYQGSSIKLSVGQTRTIIVHVLGEVTNPGTYTLSAFSTAFNALYLAGGVTDLGTLRNIKVSRGGQVISTIDVYDYIVNGRLAGNIMLQDNDVISVGAYENMVEVVGKIKRPMYYEMKKGESLQTLLSYTGGFLGDAYRQKIRIERKSSEGLTVHNVDEWDFASFTSEDGDVVVVLPIIERYKNTATITGAVFRPGSYKIGGSATSVKTLVEQAGGLLEQAITSRAVLHRMKSDRTLQSIAIDLEGIISGTAVDVPLVNEDELIIASAEKQNEDKYLLVAGEVLEPGKYPFAEGATIEDLIINAGGLLETASLENVEVARRITSGEKNEDGNQMAEVFSFNLEKGLSVADGCGFELQPYDHVIIHRNPNYQEQKSIIVTGEVKYAGRYVLSSKEQRLTDIINRAGGFTTKAYTGGAQLVRKYSKKEMDLKVQMVEMASTEEDSLTAVKQLAKETYTIGIDMEKALAEPGSMHDVILMEGDSIYIPMLNNVVKVSGEVLYPNTVTFTKAKKGRYYINQAGGVTDTGRKSKAYIVYANGQVNTLRKGEILPGCEIVVPSKIEKKVDTAKVSMWATLASTIATVGAVISNIVK